MPGVCFIPFVCFSREEVKPSFSIEQKFHEPVEKIKNIFSEYVSVPLLAGVATGLFLPSLTLPLAVRLLQVLNFPVHPGVYMPMRIALKNRLEVCQYAYQLSFISLLIPYIEEFLFRGVIQEKYIDKLFAFSQCLGLDDDRIKTVVKVVAVCLTAVLFSLWHLSNLPTHGALFVSLQLANTLFLGFVFGAAKEISGEQNLAVGMHIGNNLTATVMPLFGRVTLLW